MEPQEDCVTEIRIRNGLSKRLTIVKAAVGPREEAREFYVRACRAGSGLLHEWEGDIVKTIQVPMTTLDCLIRRFGMPGYVKIDVEGFEFEVLRGLSSPIKTISFEYHLTGSDIQKSLSCIHHLSLLGLNSVNATCAEDLAFRDPWVTPVEFLQRFPAHMRTDGRRNYGDIFCRLATPG